LQTGFDNQVELRSQKLWSGQADGFAINATGGMDDQKAQIANPRQKQSQGKKKL
jgi:hypothetical protein